MLNTKRAQLVKIMSQLIQSDEDTKKFLGEESYRNMRFYINPVIKELSASIKMIEEEMLSIIKIDEQLFENYQFAVSVPGVGKVIAIAFICATKMCIRDRLIAKSRGQIRKFIIGQNIRIG